MASPPRRRSRLPSLTPCRSCWPSLLLLCVCCSSSCLCHPPPSVRWPAPHALLIRRKDLPWATTCIFLAQTVLTQMTCSDQPPPRTRAGAHALAGSMRLRPVGSRRGYDCCCGRERRRYGKTYSPPAMGENELVHYTRAFAGRLWSMCRRYDPSYLWCWTVCMVPLEIVKEITKLNKCIWLFEEVLTLMSCGRIVFFFNKFQLLGFHFLGWRE